MSATLKHEDANLYRLTVSGLLRKSEAEKVQSAAAQEIARAGKVRLLFILEGFQGWERGADWGDLQFYETYGQNVERIAVVCEEKWREQALMFLLADMRKAPVRHFPPTETDQARAWLSL
jgi:hypothetical protein